MSNDLPKVKNTIAFKTDNPGKYENKRDCSIGNEPKSTAKSFQQ